MEAVAVIPDRAPNPVLLRQCRAAFDWWERFASSRNGAALMFLWALAEAIIWPVIPDALLAPMAAGNRRRFYAPLAAAVCGSALGALLLMLAAAWWPAPALTFLEHTPLVTDRQIQTASHELATRGARSFLTQPWSGVPFKVWGVIAGVQGIDQWSAIPLSIVARALRMTIVAAAVLLLAVDAWRLAAAHNAAVETDRGGGRRRRSRYPPGRPRGILPGTKDAQTTDRRASTRDA